MKKLIKNSIRIIGMGSPKVPTIFNTDDTNQRVSIVRFSGNNISAVYSYDEYGVIKTSNIRLNIPQLQTDDEISDFIINEIESRL